MKNCIIITSYPSSEHKLNVLKKSIQSIKDFSKKSEEQFDIILCSQIKITDEDILSSVNYFLYDEDDIESFFNYGDVYTYDFHWRFDNEHETFVDTFDNTYHFLLWKLINMALKFADSLGYEFFYYMEGDFEIISDNFFDKIVKLKHDTLEKNKSIVMFNLRHDNPEDIDFFLGVVSGGLVKKFLEIDVPVNKEGWLADGFYTSSPLEHIMYERFYKLNKEQINKIYFENELSILKDNDIIINKLHNLSGLKTLFYYDENQKDILYTFLYNSNPDAKTIRIFIDNVVFLDMLFNSNVYYINVVSIKDIMNKKVRWEIMNSDNVIFFEKEYVVDDNRLASIKRKGHYIKKNVVPNADTNKINHFYQNIDGWFDFENIYTEMVNRFGDGSKFVEIGVMFGKSTAYLGTEIFNSKKDIKIDCVDIWEVYEESGVIGNSKNCWYDGKEMLVYDKFLDNIKPVSHLIKPIKGDSVSVSKTYEDNTLDFVFIDANHEYDSVLNDIKSWYPKVKNNGVIAGHDYDWPEVSRAVIEFFGEKNIRVDNRSWIAEKKNMNMDKNNIVIFSHNYLINDWKNILIEQLDMIKYSELYNNSTEIHMNVFSNENENYISFDNIISKYDNSGKIRVKRLNKNLYEYETLGDLYDYCVNNKNVNILYIHLKGVYSGANNKYVIDGWRRCMEYFNIEKWKFCVDKLDVGYDTVGCLYNNSEDVPIYTGNFWWAKSDYVSKLEKLYYEEDFDIEPYRIGCRVKCEAWINSAGKISQPDKNIRNGGNYYLRINNDVNKFYNMYLPNMWDYYSVYIDPLIYRNINLDELWSNSVKYKIQQKKEEFVELLKYIINNVRMNNILEIGCYDGGTTSAFCQLFNNVTSIDLDKKQNINTLENIYSNFEFILGSSQDPNIYKKLKDRNILYDVIFIDGDHTMEGVEKDFYLYKDLLNNGGIVVLHDIVSSDFHIQFNCTVDKFWNKIKNNYDYQEIICRDTNNDTKLEYFLDFLEYDQWGGIGILKLNNNVQDMKICVITNIINQQDLVPYYLDHYLNYLKVDKIILYDGGSTDNTINIIESYNSDKITLIKQNQIQFDERNLMQVRNEEWKKYRNEYDWMIVCDSDEFLYHQNIRDILSKYKNDGITIPNIENGYEMIGSTEFINYNYDNNYLFNIINRGYVFDPEKKNIIFNPKKVDINYTPGGHNIQPTGNVIYSNDRELKVLHYRFLSYNIFIEKNKKQSDRLSDYSIKNNMGTHVIGYSKMTENEYNDHYSRTEIVVEKRNIVIFNHNYLINNWVEIVMEQTELLINSGLYDKVEKIYSTIYSDDNSYEQFVNIIKKYDTKQKWNFIRLNENEYEFYCLHLIKNYCDTHDVDICYYHTKGVYSETIPDNRGVKYWRKYLNHYIINRWNDNVLKLDKFDVVGVDHNYNDMHNKHVIGGNFFWTTSRHVKLLDDIIFEKNRFNAEKWILNDEVKVFQQKNYLDVGIKNPYMEIIDPKIYGSVSNKKYSFITPTYKRYKTLKICIDSVIKQNYKNWEMLICSDGNDERTKKLIESYRDPRIKYFFTEPTNFFGTHQRNFLIEKTNGDYVIFLDDDNYIYPNYLEIIDDKINDSDMLVYRIDFENYLYSVIPIEDKIEHGKIDTLNFVVRKKFTSRYKWKRIYEHDYLYFKSIEADIVEENGTIKYINDVLAKHVNLWNHLDLKIEDDESTTQSKEVVIMTSHPNYSGIENITLEAIKSFKDRGKDVILCSHTPLSMELQRAADHVVYDKNNPLIRHDFFTQSWFNTDDYYALINLTKNDNNFNHALGVYLNYYNGLILAKELGYNTAICSNFDLIFVEEDIDLIMNKINDMYSNGKDAFFMNTPETDGIHYKTIFFITNIDWFLNKLEYIYSEDVYNREIKKCGSETNCLENFIYHSLKGYKDEILLQEIDENTLFSKSRINIFSLIEYQTILPDDKCPHCFVVWFSSSNRVDDRKLNIVVEHNGGIIDDIHENITNEYRYYKKYKFESNDVYNITFVVKNNIGEILKNKTIIVNNDIFRDINSYGKFTKK